MAWLYAVLLAVAVLVLIGAEWPRLAPRLRLDTSARRARRRRKSKLRLVEPSADVEEFAASVERDLSQLPTIEERNGKR